MKIVPFKIAKALKEIDYPQGETDNTRIPKYYCANGKFAKLPLVGDQVVYFAPTYIDVWLWLWRTKNITVKVMSSGCFIHIKDDVSDYYPRSTDPEEAIVKSVDYLVNSNLIECHEPAVAEKIMKM